MGGSTGGPTGRGAQGGGRRRVAARVCTPGPCSMPCSVPCGSTKPSQPSCPLGSLPGGPRHLSRGGRAAAQQIRGPAPSSPAGRRRRRCGPPTAASSARPAPGLPARHPPLRRLQPPPRLPRRPPRLRGAAKRPRPPLPAAPPLLPGPVAGWRSRAAAVAQVLGEPPAAAGPGRTPLSCEQLAGGVGGRPLRSHGS